MGEEYHNSFIPSGVYEFSTYPESLVKANFWSGGFKPGFRYCDHFQAGSQILALQQNVNHNALQHDVPEIPIWLWSQTSQFMVSLCYKIFNSEGLTTNNSLMIWDTTVPLKICIFLALRNKILIWSKLQKYGWIGLMLPHSDGGCRGNYTSLIWKV